MRVTNRMLTANLNRNLRDHLTRLDKLQSKLSTGKQILKPSDGPADAEVIMNLESMKREIEQYMKNGEKAKTVLNLTDSVLEHTMEIFLEARDKALRGGNDPLGKDEKAALAGVVISLLSDAIDACNSTYQGRYLFSTNSSVASDSKPFELRLDANGDPIEVVFNGKEGVFNVEVAQNTRIDAGVDGKKVLVDGKVFDSLINLYKGLKDGTVDADDYISGITTAIDRILEARADAGAKIERFDLIKNRYEQDKINISRLLSRTQDVDYAETISELIQEETVYNAALKVGARVIQPSLIDYLK